ncbi:MAG TPA: hypothetical protein VHQ95_02500 [Pyrinomonadaceae bacterium]|nr:hypothetical protein [Pyrinomonadaceae bacterium]
MHTTSIEEIANAVLYEGYLLYPYRASAVKNQRRFNFGVLTPQSYSEAQRGTEPWSMQTECLLLAGSKTILEVKVRFLHLRRREVRGFYPPLAEWDQGAAWGASNVQMLEVDGQTYHSCEEAVEREVVERRAVIESTGYASRHTFSFPLTREYEPIPDSKGQIAGVIVRSQRPIEGAIELSITECEVDSTNDDARHLRRVTVKVLNQTSFAAAGRRREEALPQSLISAHTILAANGGEFISALDPPEEYRATVAACQNVGTWPVLAGEKGARDAMLSSPIILYDYPEIAAESAGELFDGTEIDEILTLRIMTLTDQEKEEMRQGDERARRILERTETMTPEDLMKLHGVLRRPRALEK